MLKSADDKIMIGLKNGECTSFELLYKLYFSSILNYINQNSGNIQDAEDVFQETVIILLVKVQQPDFVLTSSLKTYLFSISKNLWLKKLRNNRMIIKDIDEVSLDIKDDLAEYEENEKAYKARTWFQSITAYCKHILMAIFYLNTPMENLMAEMGWKNKHTAAQQKYKCLQQIQKMRAKGKN